MTQTQEKGVALHLHMNNAFDYFLLEDEDGDVTMYEGDFDEQRELFLLDIEGTEDLDLDINFAIFCSNNCTEIKDFDEDDSDYLVLTDEEADVKWEESLDNYIEDCILSEIPSYLRMYFDEEKWKRDARVDGRGHSLGHYDGNEHYEDVNETTYYIYRQN